MQGRDDGDSIVPEDIGKRCALAVLEEVERGGVVDSSHQASQQWMWLSGCHMDVVVGCMACTRFRTNQHMISPGWLLPSSIAKG